MVVTGPSFERLEVFRLAERLANEIHSSVRRWEALDKWTVGAQAIRAADSVAANIAESEGRFSYRDRIWFLRIARGSASELQYWLRRVAAQGLEGPKNGADEAARVGKMLNGLITDLRTRAGQQANQPISQSANKPISDPSA